ncbi:MAG: cadherin domain-containing protein [Bacteroidota bacterium]
MKKYTLRFILCLNTLLFITSLKAATIQDPVIVEITDATLTDVNYYQINFTVPTKLVFTNLTSVNGYIIFHQNKNLVGVEFPLLTQAGGYIFFNQNTNLVDVKFPLLTQATGYFYFTDNPSLLSIQAPKLTSIKEYLYITGNQQLATFEICGLKEIIKPRNPAYYITNNTAAIDAVPFCFYKEAPKNIALSNNTLDENSPLSTLIGNISAESSDPNQILTYSLKNNSDNYFKIVGNQLFINTPLDYETKNQYKITIAVRNQIGESTSKDFIININDINIENFTTIEITDTTLDNIIYHQTSFTGPTKLVFTNLTSVKEYISFHKNTNLISVEFPVLTQAGGYFYANENQSLESIKAPQLTTIKEYIHVVGNKNLTTFEICGLKEVVKPRNPAYYIYNNTPAVDAVPFCFYKEAPQNLTLSNNTVSENLAPDTLIGNLSADSNDPNQILTYSLKNSTESPFKIIGNQLFANSSFDYEAINQYKIKIAVRNQIGENITKDFIINITDVSPETINIIEITDTTLDNVYYYKTNFTSPTKLIFTNLTAVNGYIFLYRNTNLVGVEFPQLIQADGYFYIDGNQSLESVKAPKLTTIKDYLYVEGNQKLAELQICSLKDIQATDVSLNSYYYIRNNPLLDMATTCLTNTIVSFAPADPIVVLPAPNTLVGTFSSDATEAVNYFFIDESGNPIVNPNFTIIGDKLYLTNEYSTYDEKDFIVNIGAIRTTANASNNKLAATASTKDNSAKLNEKIQLSITLNIDNTTLGVQPVHTTENRIIIYPNPANDTFEIQSEENIIEVQLFDMLGRQLKNLKIADNKVDISSVSIGNYLVVIKTDNNSISKQKLIVKK